MVDNVSRPDPDAAKFWPDAPMRQRTRRRLAVAILVVLAIAATIVTTRWTQEKQQAEPPVEAVRAFLEASRSGDVDAALALTDDEPAAAKDLLVPEALSEDWTIGDVVLQSWLSDSGGAGVEATIISHDAELTATFDLERTGEGWRLTDPFTTLPVESAPLPYLEVNGLTVPLEPDDVEGEYFSVLPGVYRLYEHPPELLTYAGAPVLALGEDWAETEDADGIRAVIGNFNAAEGTEPSLNEQMKTYLDDCMAEDPERFGCPFAFDRWDVENEDFTPGPDRQWEIVAYPQVVAGTVGPMYTPDQLRLLVRHEGQARVTVEDEQTGEKQTLECLITANGLYLWLDDTNQYAIGPNGDTLTPADETGTPWDHDYPSNCEPT